jgi:hypothetical protein
MRAYDVIMNVCTVVTAILSGVIALKGNYPAATFWLLWAVLGQLQYMVVKLGKKDDL